MIDCLCSVNLKALLCKIASNTVFILGPSMFDYRGIHLYQPGTRLWWGISKSLSLVPLYSHMTYVYLLFINVVIKQLLSVATRILYAISSIIAAF